MSVSKLNFFDPIKTFELNPEMSINIEVDVATGVKVLTIDNFYKNPEMVEKLILDTPVSNTTECYKSAYTGYRITSLSTIYNPYYFSTLTNILRDAFELSEFLADDDILMCKGRSLTANLYEGVPNTTNSSRRHYPHFDSFLITALVYFYKSDNLGTALYKHKESGLIHIPTDELSVLAAAKQHKVSTKSILEITNTHSKDVTDNYSTTDDEYSISESNDDFEVIYKTKPKYNQLVAFLGSTLHSPLIDYKYLADNGITRVNQVLFLESLANMKKN